MMPIGPLMIEHRLIERVIRALDVEMERLIAGGELDPAYLDAAIDFIRTYADRTHHGKEEDILFLQLAQKNMSQKDREVMDELVREHVFARQTVGEIVVARARSLEGGPSARDVVIGGLRALVKLYPGHIEKEDRIFFPAAMTYFTPEEQDAMLAEMWEFDRQMIHAKYRAVAERLEQR